LSFPDLLQVIKDSFDRAFIHAAVGKQFRHMPCEFRRDLRIGIPSGFERWAARQPEQDRVGLFTGNEIGQVGFTGRDSVPPDTQIVILDLKSQPGMIANLREDGINRLISPRENCAYSDRCGN